MPGWFLILNVVNLDCFTALSHETRSFLRWVLVTADEGDDLIDVSSMTPYYQPIPQVVENENSWRHINGANDSWRATPTDSWKDGTNERATNSVPVCILNLMV